MFKNARSPRSPRKRSKVETGDLIESLESPCAFMAQQPPKTPEDVFSLAAWNYRESNPPGVRFAAVWFSSRWEIHRWRYPKRSFPVLLGFSYPSGRTRSRAGWRMGLRRIPACPMGVSPIRVGFISVDFKPAVGRDSLCHDLRDFFHLPLRTARNELSSPPPSSSEYRGWANFIRNKRRVVSTNTETEKLLGRYSSFLFQSKK